MSGFNILPSETGNEQNSFLNDISSIIGQIEGIAKQVKNFGDDEPIATQPEKVVTSNVDPTQPPGWWTDWISKVSTNTKSYASDVNKPLLGVGVALLAVAGIAWLIKK
jgi:hypothetical protein